MWSSIRQLSVSLIPKTLHKVPSPNNSTRLLETSQHILFQKNDRSLSSSSSNTILGSLSSLNCSSFLQPWLPTSLINNGLSESTTVGGGYTVSTRGMKIKGKVKRRCKECFLIWEGGILYNRCKGHPRHTQMLKPKYWANMRILTHATSGFKRPW